MNALVSYSDDEGEHDAPRTAVPATAMTSRTAPSPAKTVPSGTATGVGATAASKNMRAASHLLKSGSSSGSPLAVRQRAPLPPSGSSKLAESTSAASGLGSASAGPSVSASRSYDGSSASASVPHERSPVAGSKGKERARENEMLSAGQYAAAYRSACRPASRADGDNECGLTSVPQEGADSELEARLCNFHRLTAAGDTLQQLDHALPGHSQSAHIRQACVLRRHRGDGQQLQAAHTASGLGFACCRAAEAGNARTIFEVHGSGRCDTGAIAAGRARNCGRRRHWRSRRRRCCARCGHGRRGVPERRRKQQCRSCRGWYLSIALVRSFGKTDSCAQGGRLAISTTVRERWYHVVNRVMNEWVYIAAIGQGR